MSNMDVALARAAQHHAKRDYERQVATSNEGAQGLDACGPPIWDRQAWEAWKAQYGSYPFSASLLPPTFDGAPDWVYDLMKLRKPPVTVNLGSDGGGGGPDVAWERI